MVVEQILFGITPLIWVVNPFSVNIKMAEDKIFSYFYLYNIDLYYELGPM